MQGVSSIILPKSEVPKSEEEPLDSFYYIPCENMKNYATAVWNAE